MQIEETQKISVSPDILFQEVNGETVLLDLRNESYFGLDVIGSRIWQLLSGGACIAETVDTLLEEYDVERGTLVSDVQELIENLAAADLLEL